MPIKAVVETLEDAPEALREHYTERDGKFVLGVEPAAGFELGEIEPLKNALGAERGINEKMRRELERFGSVWDKDRKAWTHAFEPDKAKAALAELEDLRKLDPASEADKIANAKFESAKSQLLEKHSSELQEREGRIGHLSSAVQALLIDQAATAALAEAKGAVDLLLPHVKAHARVKEVDGRFVVEIVGTDGNGRIADSKGTPMTIADLVAEMRGSEKFGRAFDGEGHSGSGKEHDNGQGGAVTLANMGGSPDERRAAIAKRFKVPEA